jgi:hypothetical protein
MASHRVYPTGTPMSPVPHPPTVATLDPVGPRGPTGLPFWQSVNPLAYQHLESPRRKCHPLGPLALLPQALAKVAK